MTHKLQQSFWTNTTSSNVQQIMTPLGGPAAGLCTNFPRLCMPTMLLLSCFQMVGESFVHPATRLHTWCLYQHVRAHTASSARSCRERLGPLRSCRDSPFVFAGFCSVRTLVLAAQQQRFSKDHIAPVTASPYKAPTLHVRSRRLQLAKAHLFYCVHMSRPYRRRYERLDAGSHVT